MVMGSRRWSTVLWPSMRMRELQNSIFDCLTDGDRGAPWPIEAWLREWSRLVGDLSDLRVNGYRSVPATLRHPTGSSIYRDPSAAIPHQRPVTSRFQPSPSAVQFATRLQPRSLKLSISSCQRWDTEQCEIADLLLAVRWIDQQLERYCNAATYDSFHLTAAGVKATSWFSVSNTEFHSVMNTPLNGRLRAAEAHADEERAITDREVTGLSLELENIEERVRPNTDARRQ
ncbi:hypothetical protein PHYPSEUDO_012169 [Phytophthora pseudosyringae]|uniref:Uncharacterized protein n=1 Tax=Phytophthora pseudosyringae TaxID=221518 RepID=A0A8T1VC33_9STRA|nr:hypothetical protein PHYPSEUDO_012169 [Phytophthora pseudosyringae]